MNTSIKPVKEIVLTAPDDVGILSRISTAVAEAHVNVRAICAYEVDQVAHLRLITDNNQKALDALNKEGFKATEHNAVLCEISPHILHPEIASIAGSFDVENNYWCASAHSGEHAVLIFSPADNLKGAAIK